MAVVNDPKYAEAYYNLGIIYMENGVSEKAIEAFTQALQHQPKLIPAHNNLGLAYLQKGLTDKAIQEFRAALEIGPDIEAYMNLAGVYTLLDLREEAMRAYQAALKLDPNIFEAHYNLGLAYKENGRFGEAREHLQKTIHLKPDFGPARQALETLSK